MSQLVVRILLSVFVLPLAAGVYLVAWIWLDQSRSLRFRGVALYAGAGAAAWIFVVVYWLAVWRRLLKKRTAFWAAGALLATLLAPTAGALIGAALSAVDAIDRDISAFVGSAVTPILWMIATLFFWAENDAERARREAGAATVDRIVCPACGYDLRGQREARCPECGAAFSLGDLLDRQPGREMRRGLED